MVLDISKALYRNLRELVTKEGIKETEKFLRDSAYQTFFGELKIQPKPGHILDDPHVHYPKPRNKTELVRFLSN